MAIIITERPNFINFSKNPIRYQLTTDIDPATPGLSVEVQLFFKLINDSDYKLVIQFPCAVDAVGNVQLDLKKLLDSQLSYLLPLIDNSITLAASQSGSFYIAFRELTDSNPPWITDGFTYFILKGGLPYEKWQKNNFFDNYAGKYWLTWQPQSIELAAWQNAWVTYMHYDAEPENSQLSIKVKVFYSDVTTDESIIMVAPINSTNFQYSIYHIPIGLQQLAIDQLAGDKQVRYYQISVFVNDVSQSVTYQVYVDYNQDYQKLQFNFFNSLGGFDSVRILGEIEKDPEYARDQSESFIGGNYYGSSNLPAQQTNVQIIEQMNYKGMVGYVSNEKNHDRLRELLLSKGIYKINNRRFVPIIVTTKSAAFGNPKAPQRELQIEWSYAYTNENYAPEWIDIPVTESTAVCDTVVSNIITSQVGQIMNITFDSAGPGTQWKIIIDGTSSYIVSAKSASISGLAAGPHTGAIVAVSSNGVMCDGIPFEFTKTAVPPPSLIKLSDYRPIFSIFRTLEFQVGPNVSAGNRFSITIFGHAVIVTATSTDTPVSIANKLKDAINETTTSEWNEFGLAPSELMIGYPPVAGTTGDKISFSLYHTYTASGAAYDF
ncbi:hypothetical protein QEG73_21870 [Chitinophagaceae bacterium 26-R-25]|nr:hypothetical protein [Chitinophagaceae bacterium 26-R-25]